MSDDFRRSLLDEDDEFFAEESVVQDRPIVVRRRRFLGMTAAQRAFVSVILFLNVLVLGLGLLIVTRRIDFAMLADLIP
jgi:hypothetical protein